MERDDDVSGLYAGARRAERETRRRGWRREQWRALRDGLGAVGTLSGFTGLGLLGWASVSLAYLALGLVATAGLLLLVAAYAQVRIRRLAEPQPPAMGTRAVRFHIDDAPTVYVEPRRRP